MEITPKNAAEYARQRGLVGPNEQPRVEALSGGIACSVIRLHTERGPIVIKQAQQKFRAPVEWVVDRRRNAVEARFQALARETLGATHVPEVLDVDEASFAFTMASAPLDAQNWKAMMLDGEVRPELGRQGGELLAKLHALPPPDFLDNELFRQQRIEPYFEFIRDRHPKVQPVIDELCRRHESVTHGDYTPKNFLVSAGKLILLDYEVAHLGWPEFDIASMVNHLTLKYIHLGNPALLETARVFLAGHELNLLLFGALLLARVDGKSPAEYLREENKPVIRAAGKQLLAGVFETYEEFVADTFSGKRSARGVSL